MNKFFVLETDNRIDRTITLTISKDCEYLVEIMKDEYKKQNIYDRKNKIKHQFSQSSFNKAPFNCIIFYPNQSKITWHITDSELMNLSDCDFDDFLEEVISNSIDKHGSMLGDAFVIEYLEDCKAQIKW